MWLASLSRTRLTYPRGRVWPASEWADIPQQRAVGLGILRNALDGAGDDRWERAFRMCLTLCLHRGLSDDEMSLLPEDWMAARGRALAGGPLNVYYSRGVPDGLLSADPCHTPGREQLPGMPAGVFLPVDCGDCPPCLQRADIESGGVVCG